jgi:hypothetical protein
VSGPPSGRSTSLRVLHSKSIFYGAFVWARSGPFRHSVNPAAAAADAGTAAPAPAPPVLGAITAGLPSVPPALTRAAEGAIAVPTAGGARGRAVILPHSILVYLENPYRVNK